MSRMHAAGWCCSACSDAITVDCCVRGVPTPAGQCECELMGGYEITALTPCECSSTIVSCCLEGTTLALNDCDCRIIGGTVNPTICVPDIDPGDPGCNVCVSIVIQSRGPIPYFWPCLRNQNTNAGPCVSIYGGSICDCPPYYPYCTEIGMCFNYPECVTVTGDCVTCSNGNTNCVLTGTYRYYRLDRNENVGLCPTPGSSTTANTISVCDTSCCENPFLSPLNVTSVNYTVRKCGTFNQVSSGVTSDFYDGSGCSVIDVNTVVSSVTLTSYTCLAC